MEESTEHRAHTTEHRAQSTETETIIDKNLTQRRSTQAIAEEYPRGKQAQRRKAGRSTASASVAGLSYAQGGYQPTYFE